MKTTARAIVTCALLALYVTTLRATQPASPPGSPGATPLTAGVAVSLLILSLLVASYLARKRPRSRSVASAILHLSIAVVPIGFASYGAATGWIRLIGRYGHLNDYSVITSPLGYWGTYTFYLTVSTILLSWAIASLRQGGAP
jgi:hypothetical protein